VSPCEFPSDGPWRVRPNRVRERAFTGPSPSHKRAEKHSPRIARNVKNRIRPLVHGERRGGFSRGSGWLTRILTTSNLEGKGAAPSPDWGAYRGSRGGCQQEVKFAPAHKAKDCCSFRRLGAGLSGHTGRHRQGAAGWPPALRLQDSGNARRLEANAAVIKRKSRPSQGLQRGPQAGA
jgi:hypothetical protein